MIEEAEKRLAMQADYHRDDISDRVWGVLQPHLKGRKGTWGGNVRDNRKFINGVFWILRTRAPWGDLPPDYGGWKNVHRRFAAGATRANGSGCWNCWLGRPTSSG